MQEMCAVTRIEPENPETICEFYSAKQTQLLTSKKKLKIVLLLVQYGAAAGLPFLSFILAYSPHTRILPPLPPPTLAEDAADLILTIILPLLAFYYLILLLLAFA